MSKECKKGLHIYNKDLKSCPECKKLYYQANKEKIKTDHQTWKKENNRSVNLYKKQYYLDHKEKINLNVKKWRNANLERSNTTQKKYQTNRLKFDINYKLTKIIRSRISAFIRLHKINKIGSAIQDLGCSVEELKLYLENKFKPGMTWGNYGIGPGLWAIDHIAPLCSFNLTIKEQFLKACHYTNLQPLWHEDHVIKTIEDKKRTTCQKE